MTDDPPTTIHCGHCGRHLARMEAMVGQTPVCHPDDPEQLDCYRLVTVYHEELGARLGNGTGPGGGAAINPLALRELEFEQRLTLLLEGLPLQRPRVEAAWVQRAAQRLALSITAYGRPTQGGERVAVRRAIAQTDLWLQAPRREVS